MAIALLMEATNTSETPVIFYKTTRREIPEDSHFGKLRFRRVWQNRTGSLIPQNFLNEVITFTKETF